MKLQEYINAISNFKKRETPWFYSPNKCENKICCSDKPIQDGNEIHGMINLSGQYEPIVICEDCLYQIENKLFINKFKALKGQS